MSIQAYVLDSSTGAVAKINSPLMLDARAQLAEYHEIVKAVADSPSRGSRKLKQKLGTQIDGVTCASKPFDMALFAYAATVNTYHARAISAKAKDIVGRPWMIIGDGSTATRKTVEDFFARAFGRRSFGAGMKCVWTDYEALGNGFLEVIPNAKGEPTEFEHIPATEMWVRLDGLGFVQSKAGEHAHFRAWGVAPKRFQSLNSKDPLMEEVTYVIHFNRYSPWSPYYGLPSVLPAWSAICLMTLVAEYNLTFFNNNAIPDYAVILEGDVEEGAEELIRQYFKRHLKGQAHKTLVLSTPAGGKIRFDKLTDSSAREGSFRLLRTDCRDEILQAHGVPPQKVGIVETGKLGGNLSSEQIREYQLSIIDPGQAAVAEQMTSVIADGFGVGNLSFAFERTDIEDRLVNAQVDQIYLDRGVLVPNEVRADRFPDKEPLDGGDDPLRGPTLAELSGIDDAVGQMQREIKEAISQ